MSDVTVKLNHDGIRELLKSEAVQNLVAEHAQDVKNAAGDGYGVRVSNTGGRARASVYTADFQTMREERENNTLLKALGSHGTGQYSTKKSKYSKTK